MPLANNRTRGKLERESNKNIYCQSKHKCKLTCYIRIRIKLWFIIPFPSFSTQLPYDRHHHLISSKNHHYHHCQNLEWHLDDEGETERNERRKNTKLFDLRLREKTLTGKKAWKYPSKEKPWIYPSYFPGGQKWPQLNQGYFDTIWNALHRPKKINKSHSIWKQHTYTWK